MKKAGGVVFCSSTGEEESVEIPALQQGAFTFALLEGMKGEADKLPQDGVVTLAELQAFVSVRVSNLTGGRQHPRIPVQIGANPAAQLARVR